ncbi:MAG TPA: valine--tRNA ligase [Alphaproteobacteria bacterium]|nr:valine--tRNA ligase [Alphaproteobacteria bacterium]
MEARHYEKWEASGAFACDPCSAKEPYTIIMPPPNVTGSLHMGHALTFTLQDILIRYHRMAGRDVLWQPGQDHAGIATQMVVERQLTEEGKSRHDLGRDAFIQRVWDWKAESGGAISQQLRRLGASADWPRDRFTLDEGVSKAVVRVFVDLYRQGLIYKDQRLVNWDPALETAISDLEVEQKEIKGHLWYFKYPVEDQPDRFLTVATTRPETMLGDTAVAVHPEDDRYRDLIGKHCMLPIVGRKILIVADDYADPETGSGAVKITPAHDFNDFEVGRRHDLEMINVLDRKGRINENAPTEYQGLDRFEARKKVVAAIEELGLLEKIEPHTHMVPYGDRGGVPIEPYLTEQWYVDAETLAKPAIEAVETGKTKFVPENWSKTYFEWMRNIQPWCISRQLWWGHQIPAWYGPDGEIFVAHDEDQAKTLAKTHYGEEKPLERDPDVLDTWFSSGLWPFSTLGWPEETPELKRYYPGDVLVTGFDIIFFWVARMMMMGLHFMDDVPFRAVYIHALVRDEKGQKMSKSKGNIIDPLELIERYSADALRFTLAIMAAQGRDIKLSPQRVEGYRNFGTKLWNAARFCEMNRCALPADFDPAAVQQTVNRWIVGETARATAETAQDIEAYKFNEAAGGLYQFVWGTFCDWYLEFIKPILNGDDAAAAAETRATAAWVLDQILLTLHPFMPFITEELNDHFGFVPGRPLITAPWPSHGAGFQAPEAKEEMDWVVRLISEIRAVRAEMNVPAGAQIPCVVQDANPETIARLERHAGYINRLARLEGVTPVREMPKEAVQLIIGEATFALPLADVIDIAAERERLQKAIAKIEGEIGAIDKRLSNPGFLAKADPAVVDETREKREALVEQRDRLAAAVERLASA